MESNEGREFDTTFLEKHPRAIAIDLDGTLLDSKSNLSVRSRSALDKCMLLGLPVVIATSRAERTIRSLLPSEILDKCSLVMMNGAIAKSSPPLTGFLIEIIPSDIASKIITLATRTEPSARVGIELEGFEFGLNVKLDRKTLWEINAATSDMVLTLDEAIKRKPAKIFVNGLGRDLSTIAQEIRHKFSESVSVVPSSGMKFLNILSIRASKPKALQYLLNSRQISLDEVVAFGDDLPDLELLEMCGMSVAVANAVPEILACARFHTASNDADGVAVVLEKIIAAMS